MGEVRSVWPAGLTDREIEVLRTLATGASRHEMAKRLCLSEHTVRHHLEHIYAKIDVKTRVEATLFAIEHGLLA
jgi:DNA-binding CsgD family transcriptional regulator